MVDVNDSLPSRSAPLLLTAVFRRASPPFAIYIFSTISSSSPLFPLSLYTYMYIRVVSCLLSRFHPHLPIVRSAIFTARIYGLIIISLQEDRILFSAGARVAMFSSLRGARKDNILERRWFLRSKAAPLERRNVSFAFASLFCFICSFPFLFLALECG